MESAIEKWGNLKCKMDTNTRYLVAINSVMECLKYHGITSKAEAIKIIHELHDEFHGTTSSVVIPESEASQESLRNFLKRFLACGVNQTELHSNGFIDESAWIDHFLNEEKGGQI
ncbi:MAG: hypothetical protein RJQ09_21410 [Cyclobacteriaceae bacterium]